MFKLLLFIFTLLVHSLAVASPSIETSAAVYDSLIKAMSSRALEQQSISTEQSLDSAIDRTSTCLWGGWISTRDDDGLCQPAFRVSVHNDPYIKSFGPTYNAAMRCGAPGLYRCNPVFFGTGEGRDNRGFCVNLPQADSALLMNACREAAVGSAQSHLKKMETDAELLAQYINQVAEIALQCQKAGNDSNCQEFVSAVSKDLKPALDCHESSALFPYMSATLSSNNMQMIDQLTGSLATEYNRHIDEMLRDRNRAIEHNQSLMQQAISQYSSSPQVERMWNKLEDNFTNHFNSARRRTGTKRKQASVGRCLMYTKLAMVDAGYFSQYPSQAHAKDFGPHLTRAGFTNLMSTPGFESITPENAPPGAVIVYRGGPSGHIEIKMEDGGYGSDHWNDVPINDYLNRIPTGIYVKIPEETLQNLVEVP